MICMYARYTNETTPFRPVAAGGGGDGVVHLFRLSRTGTKERRRQGPETEGVEECALSVIGAARRCI